MKSRRCYGDGLVRSDSACVEYLVGFVCFRNQLCREKLLYIKSVLGVRVRKILVVGVSGDVVLIREERTHTAKLQDALAAVENRQLVYGGKLLAELLVIQAVRGLTPAAFAGIVVE